MNLENIYLEYKDKVHGYLVHKLNHSATAEDLCSEVFLKVYENIEKYDPRKASLSTWIFNITRNTLYDYYRTRHETEELNETIPAEDDFLERLCTEEMLEALADAMEALPERECEIIIRHYYNNETLNSIAEHMGISYSYMRILHTSALGKIKNFFENH